MVLDLDALASFMVLVEERHYGRAAARLYVTQPTLSRRVQRLERQVGTELAERTPHSFTLTSAGREVAGLAPGLLGHARRLALSAAGTTRHVTLGLPAGMHGVGSAPQLAFLRAFLDRRCSPRLECRRLARGEAQRGLLSGEVDVLWTVEPPVHAELVSIPLAGTGPHCRRAAVRRRTDTRPAVGAVVDALRALPAAPAAVDAPSASTVAVAGTDRSAGSVHSSTGPPGRCATGGDPMMKVISGAGRRGRGGRLAITVAGGLAVAAIGGGVAMAADPGSAHSGKGGAPPAGTAVLPGTTVVTGTAVTVPANGYVSAMATCPAGTYAYGGGEGNSSNGGVLLTDSRPAGGNAWQVYVLSTTSSSATVTPYVVCGI